LIVRGSVKPIVERVYPLGEAGEALRHLIEDRPFLKSSWRGDLHFGLG
jgi:NADPH2:quinone reductase